MEKDVNLQIHLVEDDTDTEAIATLNLRGEVFEAKGRARRNPTDPAKPIIGEELAIARALARLEDQLADAAWSKVETFLIPS